MPQPGNLQKTYKAKMRLFSISTIKTLISLAMGKTITNQTGTHSHTSTKIVEDEMRMDLSFFLDFSKAI